MTSRGHRPTGSVSQVQNHKAQLASAYNELGKELSSQKIRVVGNYTLGKVIGEGMFMRLIASPVASQVSRNLWQSQDGRTPSNRDEGGHQANP